ncbi:MAG TPA: hypothetical protein VGF67_16810 [Ktedonobacteraceae bacterium]
MPLLDGDGDQLVFERLLRGPRERRASDFSGPSDLAPGRGAVGSAQPMGQFHRSRAGFRVPTTPELF